MKTSVSNRRWRAPARLWLPIALAASLAACGGGGGGTPTAAPSIATFIDSPVQGLAYARVDLLPSAKGPQLLELELTEPSLFFHTATSAADRFVAALRESLRDRG